MDPCIFDFCWFLLHFVEKEIQVENVQKRPFFHIFCPQYIRGYTNTIFPFWKDLFYLNLLGWTYSLPDIKKIFFWWHLLIFHFFSFFFWKQNLCYCYSSARPFLIVFSFTVFLSENRFCSWLQRQFFRQMKILIIIFFTQCRKTSMNIEYHII